MGESLMLKSASCTEPSKFQRRILGRWSRVHLVRPLRCSGHSSGLPSVIHVQAASIMSSVSVIRNAEQVLEGLAHSVCRAAQEISSILACTVLNRSRTDVGLVIFSGIFGGASEHMVEVGVNSTVYSSTPGVLKATTTLAAVFVLRTVRLACGISAFLARKVLTAEG